MIHSIFSLGKADVLLSASPGIKIEEILHELGFGYAGEYGKQGG
jgi:hypothetical protein